MARTLDTGTSQLTAEVTDDGVGIITMNRPEARNAMTGAMLAGLSASLADFETAHDVRAVVLTGAGGAFCAGGDVKAFAAGDGAGGGAVSWDVGVHEQRLNHRATSGVLFNMPKPTLALACDMRVAVDTAVITTAFARVGLAGDYGGTWFLTRLVGPAKAKELYFLPERMDMATALSLGIVNRVVPADGFDAAWRDLAARLAALRYMKENINRAVTADLWTLLDLESTHHRHTGTTEDHKEASKAFVDKREPVFKGR